MKGSLLLVLLSLTAVYSLTYNYGDFTNANLGDFQLNGESASLNPSSDGVLVLTSPTTYKSGSAFFKNQISLANSASFSAAFAFKMEQAGGYGDSDGAGADGIVFIINSVTNVAGTYGSGMGYQGIQNSIGIEFDSYHNGEVGDIDGNHVGINFNGAVTSVPAAHYSVRFNDGNTHYAWVDYDGSTQTLEVRVAETNSRPTNAFLSKTINLAQVFGNPNVYFGFSSGTGAGWSRHLISSLSVRDDYNPIPSTPPPGPVTPPPAPLTMEQFCAQANKADWTWGQGYYCWNQQKGFIQCWGDDVVQVAYQDCAYGTTCRCNDSRECSNHGTTTPCSETI